mmetsp:Transcript_40402/g.60599  ORF Transcript_40402/g.60599 Transcript_40402/m.60599 type:complete len:131 (+) Transcript_40402:1195-1587(+)
MLVSSNICDSSCLTSLESAEITTGDVFITLGSQCPSTTKGKTDSAFDMPEQSKKRIDTVPQYFRYLSQHVWIHFLPLAAQDAGFLTRDCLQKKKMRHSTPTKIYLCNVVESETQLNLFLVYQWLFIQIHQ